MLQEGIFNSQNTTRYILPSIYFCRKIPGLMQNALLSNSFPADWEGRVLIIKPSSLGDIVHALPVLSALRRTWPKAHLAWMVRTELAGLFACVQGVDDLVLFDRRTMGRWYTAEANRQIIAFLRQLRTGRYTLVLDLQGLLRSGLFGWLSGCRIRVGLHEAREGARLFYTHIAPPPKSVHLLEIYGEMLHMLGAALEPVDYGLHIPRQAQEQARTLLQQEGIFQEQYAVLAVGSARREKCWPAERFARIAAFLHQEANLPVVLIGSGKEQPDCRRVRNLAGVPAAVLAGKTSLEQLAAVLKQAAIAVGNDTGPMHLAAALQRPTVIIFGPTNPARLALPGEHSALAAVNPWGRGNAVDNPEPIYRIEQVSLEAVLEPIQRLLKKNRP